MDTAPSTPTDNATEVWPPPFGPAEWECLRALDKRCKLNFDRYDRDHNPRPRKGPPKPDRVWLCSILLQDGMAYESVRVIKPCLKITVLEALNKAEKRGWHRPRG